MQTCNKCGFSFHVSDRYCSGCRLLLCGLEVSPDPREGLVLFKPPLGTDRATLRLRNVGQRTLDIRASVEQCASVEVGDDAGVRADLAQLQPEAAVALEILGPNANPGDRGTVVLSYPGEEIRIPFQVLDSPRLRIEVAEDAARVLSREDLSLHLELDGPDGGPGHARLPMRLRGPQLRQPLVIESLEGPESPGITVEPMVELPFSVDASRDLQFGLRITEAALQRVAPGTHLEVPLSAQVRGMQSLTMSLRILVRPRARLEVSNWEAFADDDMVLVRGVGDSRHHHIELKNRGQIAAEVLAIHTDIDFVEAGPMPTDPVVSADGGHVGFPITFHPDRLPEQDYKLGPNGDVVTIHFEVTYRSDGQMPETLTIPRQVRVADAPDLQYPLIVDFGTTNTCVAWWQPQGGWAIADVHVRENESGDEFPSLMMFLDHQVLKNGKWDVALDLGDNLKGLRSTKGMSRAIAAHFKSRLWSKSEHWIQEWRNGDLGDPKAYTGAEIVRWYFRAIVTYAQRVLRQRVQNLFLTYPAIRQFDAGVKQSLREAAAEGAGIPVEKVQCRLAEPEALGYSELLKMNGTLTADDQFTFAIVDIGGGTTDVSLYKVLGKGIGQDVTYYMLRSVGIDVAGEAITFRLARRFLMEGLEKIKNPALRQEYAGVLGEIPEDWYRFSPARLKNHHNGAFSGCRGQAERIKREIGRRPKTEEERSAEAPVQVFASFSSETENTAIKEDIYFDLAIDELRAEVAPLVEQILGTLTDAITEVQKGGHLDAGVVDRILLRGNGSRFKAVHEGFEERFGAAKIHVDDLTPKTGVALGAGAYWYYRNRTGSGPKPAEEVSGGERLMRDVGLAHGPVFKPLLRSGDPLDNVVSDLFPRIVTNDYPYVEILENYDGTNLGLPMNGNHGKALVGTPLDLSDVFGRRDEQFSAQIQLRILDGELSALVQLKRKKQWEKLAPIPVALWDAGGWLPIDPEGV